MPDGAVDGFGFTGEMTDDNGLVHLRARYYDPTVGVFASLDPFEGMNNRPMSMNGYSWVEGNVANWIDPSGLCPELSDEVYNMADYLHCHDLVRRLKDWNIKVVWDENSLSPLTCIPQTVRETAEQSQGIKQRWTVDEVRSVYNAFQIFNKAHQTFLLLGSDSPDYRDFPIRNHYSYFWPRLTSITIQKQQYVQEGADKFMGLTEDNTITLSAIRWGQANPNMTLQSRSWLVLHEFSHIYVKDRAELVNPDAIPYYVQSE